jgi:hypothetical protein
MLSFFFIVDNLNVSFINNKRSQLIRLFYVVSKKVEEFYSTDVKSRAFSIGIYICVNVIQFCDQLKLTRY